MEPSWGQKADRLITLPPPSKVLPELTHTFQDMTAYTTLQGMERGRKSNRLRREAKRKKEAKRSCQNGVRRLKS